MKPTRREPDHAVERALELLRTGGTHEQAGEILVTALLGLPADAQDMRDVLMLKAWIAACAAFGSEDRSVEAKGILDETLPQLRTASVAVGADAGLRAALATAEVVAGWIAICRDDDATAHIHFRRAIQAYDTCTKCEPEDALFAAYFYVVTSMDPDLSPQAMYEWSQPYLETLPPLHCRYGAQLLDLLGDWFLLEGEIEKARNMYTMVLHIADVNAAHEASKQTVQELVEGVSRKLSDARPGSV